MKLKEYLKQPENIWKIIIGVFTLGMVWSSLNIQIQRNSDDIGAINDMHLDVAIMQIQTDLTWIRKSLEKR